MFYIYEELRIKKQVVDGEELRKFLYELHADYNLRGSNFDWGGSILVDANGKRIGRVSYNGRVWDENDKEIII